jgi:hypothetical protein
MAAFLLRQQQQPTTDRGGREKYSLYVHVINGLKNELLISLCRKEVEE